ncbi:uncharacterized protein [Physcomitrium patens]|uniref:uncharacterized protein n=1 Tax=Physcomitrium patens TaxID=3218 RepID=UPI003CCE50C3
MGSGLVSRVRSDFTPSLRDRRLALSVPSFRLQLALPSPFLRKAWLDSARGGNLGYAPPRPWDSWCTGASRRVMWGDSLITSSITESLLALEEAVLLLLCWMSSAEERDFNGRVERVIVGWIGFGRGGCSQGGTN